MLNICISIFRMKIYKHKGKDSGGVLIVGQICNLQNIAFCQFIKTDIYHWLSFSSAGSPWIFLSGLSLSKECYVIEISLIIYTWSLNLGQKFPGRNIVGGISFHQNIPEETVHLLPLFISLDHHWLQSFLRSGYSVFPLFLQDSLVSTQIPLFDYCSQFLPNTRIRLGKKAGLLTPTNFSDMNTSPVLISRSTLWTDCFKLPGRQSLTFCLVYSGRFSDLLGYSVQ